MFHKAQVDIDIDVELTSHDAVKFNFIKILMIF